MICVLNVDVDVDVDVQAAISPVKYWHSGLHAFRVCQKMYVHKPI